jgi:hypothetical protein
MAAEAHNKQWVGIAGRKIAVDESKTERVATAQANDHDLEPLAADARARSSTAAPRADSDTRDRRSGSGQDATPDQQTQHHSGIKTRQGSVLFLASQDDRVDL